MSSWKNPGGEGVGVPAQTQSPQRQRPGIPRNRSKRNIGGTVQGILRKASGQFSGSHTSASSLTLSGKEMFP